jgi:hypothetical protein
MDEEQHIRVKHNSTASLFNESIINKIVIGKKLNTNEPTMMAAVLDALFSSSIVASL